MVSQKNAKKLHQLEGEEYFSIGHEQMDAGTSVLKPP
jgi:hypothetical protein